MFKTIEFTSIDEIVEIVDARFKNANVEFIESERDEFIITLNMQYENDEKIIVDVDALHFNIETNLRLNHALKYVRSLQFDNEFQHTNLYVILSNDEFSMFALIRQNDEIDFEHACNVIVKNDLSIYRANVDDV